MLEEYLPLHQDSTPPPLQGNPVAWCLGTKGGCGALRPNLRDLIDTEEEALDYLEMMPVAAAVYAVYSSGGHELVHYRWRDDC